MCQRDTSSRPNSGYGDFRSSKIRPNGNRKISTLSKSRAIESARLNGNHTRIHPPSNQLIRTWELLDIKIVIKVRVNFYFQFFAGLEKEEKF